MDWIEAFNTEEKIELDKEAQIADELIIFQAKGLPWIQRKKPNETRKRNEDFWG